MVNIVENNNTDAMNASEYALVDFNATWCGPCKMLGPVVEELSGEYAGKVDFYSVDVDDNPKLAEKYNVMNIPTLVILKKGEKVAQTVGFQPKPVLAKWIEGAMA